MEKMTRLPFGAGRVVASGMLRENTPVEHYLEYDLYVKREDLSCLRPGPPFSKARGVYVHVASRPEKLIGVLDTRHSQAGHAVARACSILGKTCVNYYPEFKHDPGHRPPQERAKELGAELRGIPAGMSAVLWNIARKDCLGRGGYMMPNALKLSESVTETAKEVPKDWDCSAVVIPASSGTIAAGVVRGFCTTRPETRWPLFVVHMGYSRSKDELAKYILDSSGIPRGVKLRLIDEEYEYKDTARPGPTPPWPCNEYYDLKAFRWLTRDREKYKGKILFWNIG